MILQQLAAEALGRQRDVADFLLTAIAAQGLREARFATGDVSQAAKAMSTTAKMAAVYAIAPEMGATVQHAADTMPEDELVMEDDLLSTTGILYLGDHPIPMPFRPGAEPYLVDTLLWRRDGAGFNVVGFRDRERNRHLVENYEGRRDEVPRSMSVAHCNQVFGEPIRNWVTGDDPSGISIQMAVVWLAAMRIMQQTYSETITQRPPSGMAKRLERANQTNAVQIIQFRQKHVERLEADPTGRHLETRHIRRGHWRRHQRYKTEAGEWAEKSVYIAETIVGPDGAPFVVNAKVGVLRR